MSRNNTRHSRVKKKFKVSHISKIDAVENLKKDLVNDLLSMIFDTHTTSILNVLEEYRQKLNETEFRSLILFLTTELNSSTWKERIEQRHLNGENRNFYRTFYRKQDNIDRCTLIVLYYIVSVINKYKISDADRIWTQILNNLLTQKIEFYRFLYKNKIIIPDTICRVFSKKLSSFYRRQSAKDYIKLIQLGFNINIYPYSCKKIKDYEELFNKLKRHELFNKNLKSQQFLYRGTTPEQLSIFLFYFPDYDLNAIHPVIGHNILDQIIDMNPYFYPAPKDNNDAGQIFSSYRLARLIMPRTTDASELGSYPNEITKYRAVRVLNLFQSVILKGAQFSKPVFNHNYNPERQSNQFFNTSIGIYALIGLRMDDIYPSKSSWECDNKFVLSIIRLVGNSQPEFHDFILHYLSSSYSIIHKTKFIEQQRRNENVEIQKINDKLFQSSLTLKEWCRLKLKDICPQKQINQLNLSKSLIDFCSFDLLSSNYAFNCIKQVIAYKGNVMPNHRNVLPRYGDNSNYEQIMEDDFSNDDDEILSLF